MRIICATIIIKIIVLIISACVESGHSRHRQRRATLLVRCAAHGSPRHSAGFQTTHTSTLEKEAIVPECEVVVSLLRNTCMSYYKSNKRIGEKNK